MVSSRSMIAAVALLLVGSTGSYAADYEAVDVAVWDGFYGGVGVGYGWSEQKNSFEDITNLSGLLDSDTSLTTKSEDNLASIHLGRMWQRDSFVFGIEASGMLGSFNDSASASFDDFVIGSEFLGFYAVVDDAFETETKSLFNVTGRLGFASGETLFYAKGGLASARINTTTSVSGAFGGCVILAGCGDIISGEASDSTSERHYGFVVGGGLQQKLNDYLSVGVDYTYTKLQAKTHKGTLAGSAELFEAIEIDIPSESYKVRVDPDGIHAVQGTLSIHFN